MKYHLVGIGGIGMSGLAEILRKDGHEVKGSNIVKNENCERLEKSGIKIFYDHSRYNIDGDEIVVYSNAIKEDNSELIHAKLLNLKIIPRGKMLSLALKSKKLITISGSHGKTSSTSILSQLLSECKPLVILGGIMESWKSNIRFSRRDIAIVEADESDNSFLYLKNSKFAVVTNIDHEHMDFHKNIETLKKSFEKFIKSSEIAIVNNDNFYLKEISNINRCITYSLEGNGYINGKILNDKNFEVTINNKNLGIFETNLKGNHNFSNLLPLIYISLEMNIPLNKLKEKIKNLYIAKRRCEVIYNNEIKIVDDCAHHPTEVIASLQALKLYEHKRLLLIFQPHRYSRMSLIYTLFKNVFKNVDKLFITDIFSAGEENVYDISTQKIIDILENSKELKYISDKEKIVEIVMEEIIKGDLVIFMGLGDIYMYAYNLRATLLSKKFL